MKAQIWRRGLSSAGMCSFLGGPLLCQGCGEGLSGNTSAPFRSGRTPSHFCEVPGVAVTCLGMRKPRLGEAKGAEDTLQAPVSGSIFLF